jgi:short-subunit dehydrogenase
MAETPSKAWTGQVAIVTGASSGIGRELARQLAASGARVGLIARRQGLLDELAGTIRRSGGTAVSAAADVRRQDEVQQAVARLREALGPIDLMIANAGVGAPTVLDPVNLADVNAMIEVNVLGVVYAFAAVLPEMLSRRSGRLAAVSSLAGYVGLPGESAYCASKAAVNAYLEGLRAHLHGRGVAVTTLCPGFVKTAMTEQNDFWMPGLLTADEAARRMLRAVAQRRAVYNFPLSATLLTRLVRLLPHAIVARLMSDYNEEAAAQFSSA